MEIIELKPLVVDCPDKKALVLVSHCLKECKLLHQVRAGDAGTVVECGEFENRILGARRLDAKSEGV